MAQKSKQLFSTIFHIADDRVEDRSLDRHAEERERDDNSQIHAPSEDSPGYPQRCEKQQDQLLQSMMIR